jgi:hypothetical protein
VLKRAPSNDRRQQTLAAKRRQRERDRQGLALYQIIGHRERVLGLLVAKGYLRDGVAHSFARCPCPAAAM